MDQRTRRVNPSGKLVKKRHGRNGLLEGHISEAAQLNGDREELLLSGAQGYVEAEEGTLERTGKLTQQEIAQNVAAHASSKAFNLNLSELGPYHVDWTGNGRHLLLAGNKGHVAILDNTNTQHKLVTEMHLREVVRDACFLHNESMFAVAQHKSLFIYDRDGVELHSLREHIEPTRLGFLPYHFLLAVGSATGYLKFQDVSTGTLVSEHRTKLGACNVLGINPQNGVTHLGHHNGTVTLWSPATPQPLVKLLCHRGPLQALAIDPSGKYMATAGADAAWKVWDVRMWKETHSYLTHKPVSSLAVSQTGAVAVGFGSHVQVWRDGLMTKSKAPYMRHELPGSRVSSVRWRPFEDVLGLGHTNGFTSLVIPGTGEANYDALEHNPFESRKERREAEVHRLLDKLPPETIALNQEFLGRVDVDPKLLKEEQTALQALDEAKNHEGQPEGREKRRMRGRSKIGAQLKRKRKNIIDSERVQLQARLDKERFNKASAKNSKSNPLEGGSQESAPPKAIGRFF